MIKGKNAEWRNSATETAEKRSTILTGLLASLKREREWHNIGNDASYNKEDEDVFFMRRCLSLASNALLTAKPNPMVGAVIVCHGRIIGEGYHICFGEAHAEVNAFASVKQEDEHLLSHSTLYVSLEPCSHFGKTPPCADLIISKGVKRVVVGCVDPFAEVQGRGIQKLRDAGIEVVVGVLEKECMELNRRFITFHREHRPYIILKWAQTANGFIDNNFSPLAISTPFTQMLTHKLRSESDAILVGKTTDEREHPLLDVRHWCGRNPQRFVLSSNQSVETLLADMYRNKIQSLIVEGGAKTHQAFINGGWWDELRVEISPITVDKGTRAVLLPDDVVLTNRQVFDDNIIYTYRRKR